MGLIAAADLFKKEILKCSSAGVQLEGAALDQLRWLSMMIDSQVPSKCSECDTLKDKRIIDRIDEFDEAIQGVINSNFSSEDAADYFFNILASFLCRTSEGIPVTGLNMKVYKERQSEGEADHGFIQSWQQYYFETSDVNAQVEADSQFGSQYDNGTQKVSDSPRGAFFKAKNNPGKPVVVTDPNDPLHNGSSAKDPFIAIYMKLPQHRFGYYLKLQIAPIAQLNTLLTDRLLDKSELFERIIQILQRTMISRHDRVYATKDELSDLPNRRTLTEALKGLSSRAKKSRQMDQQTQDAVVMADGNRFKTINDSLGHEAGDIVIQTMARRLAKMVRGNDLAARYGGDEFTLILRNVKDAIPILNKIKSYNEATPFIIPRAALRSDWELLWKEDYSIVLKHCEIKNCFTENNTRRILDRLAASNIAFPATDDTGQPIYYIKSDSIDQIEDVLRELCIIGDDATNFLCMITNSDIAIKVTMSFGVDYVNPQTPDAKIALKNADRAMYAVKEADKTRSEDHKRIGIYDPLLHDSIKTDK